MFSGIARRPYPTPEMETSQTNGTHGIPPQTVKTASSPHTVLQISFWVYHDDYCVVNPGPPHRDVPAFVMEQTSDLACLHRNDHGSDDTKARSCGSFTQGLQQHGGNYSRSALSG